MYFSEMAEAQPEQSCSICSEKFSSERPAVALPCEEHSFCKMCICRIEMGVDRRCPNCHITWTHDIIEPSYSALAKIAFNNGKVELTSKQENEKLLCNSHDLKTQFFCNDCNDILCVECVTSSHRMHDFHTLPNSTENVRQVINNHITDMECRVSENLRGCELKLKEFDQILEALATMEEEILDAIDQLDGRKNSLNASYDKLIELEIYLHSMKTELDNTKNYETLSKTLRTVEDLTGKINLIALPSEDKSETLAKIIMPFMVSKILYNSKTDSREGKLKNIRHNLHLHTTIMVVIFFMKLLVLSGFEKNSWRGNSAP